MVAKYVGEDAGNYNGMGTIPPHRDATRTTASKVSVGRTL